MITRVTDFLLERKSQIAQNSTIQYACLGGSHVIGTAGATSDIDVRLVVAPNEDLVYGLNTFEHSKIVEGIGGVNGADELDIEVYSTRKFIQSLYNGEVIAVEMLHCPKSGVIFNTGALKRLFELKDIFLTKKLARNYCSYAYGMWQRSMHAKRDKVKSEVRLGLLEDFGYETKYAMKSHLYFTMAKELLYDQELNIARPDVDFLNSLRSGTYSKEKMNYHLEVMNKDCQNLLERSALPMTPDFETVNRLCVSLVRG